MINKAIILAAGRGTRLQPLTYDLPKPMIPLLGKPVMEYIIEHLARQGIGEIMVNVSHMADRIESYFGDGRRFGVSIGYSFEGHVDEGRIVPEPLGSAGALRKIQDLGGFIDDTTAVLCGDAIVNVDLQAAAARHRSQGAIASVISREVALDEVSSYGVIVSDARGRVRSFQEKPSPAQALSRQASAGIYLIEPEVLAQIPADTVYDIGGELFPKLVAQGLPFFNQCLEFDWLDIGRVADYWQIVQRLMQGGMAGVELPGTEQRPGVRTGLNTCVDWEHVRIEGPVYIGSGSRIEAGVTLKGPVWIGRGCHVQAGACVERSVLFDYASVGAHAHAREAIVSGSYCVSREAGFQLQSDGLPPQRWWGDARRRHEDAAVLSGVS